MKNFSIIFRFLVGRGGVFGRVFRLFVIFVLMSGAYWGVMRLTGNFHSVVAGEFYRSAQPVPERIAKYQKDYHIKSIVNLRGENKGASWYDAEVAESARLGITHINFGMSSQRELTAEQVTQLISIFEKAEKPILVHCEGGADRSSLASALYLAAIKKSSEADAKSQFSIRFGHFSLPFTSRFAMDQTFEASKPILGYSEF